MSEKVFTYLLGAGASYNSVPIVNEFINGRKKIIKTVNDIPQIKIILPGLKDFINEIGSKMYGKNLYIEHSGEIIRSHLKEFEEGNDLPNIFIVKASKIIDQIEKHRSIDTYARKLYLKGQPDDISLLMQLKSLTDVYLRFVQMKSLPDYRYDAFFATVLGLNEGSVYFPSNLNILSWNYDNQLEYSLQSFFNSKDKQALLENHEHFNFFPGQDHNKYLNELGSIIKLNGQAFSKSIMDVGYQKGTGEDFFSENFPSDIFGKEVSKLELLNLVQIFNAHTKSPDGERSSIEYAWEKTPIVKGIRKITPQVIEKTKYLIIIGYSFPNFNRSLDRRLLRENMQNLERVYIQSPPETIDAVVQRFKAIRPMKDDFIERVTYTDEFCIPDEMDLTY